MVECTGLENRRARKGTVGSNPTGSVSTRRPVGLLFEFPSNEIWLNRKVPHDEDAAALIRLGHPNNHRFSSSHPRATYHHELGHAMHTDYARPGHFQVYSGTRFSAADQSWIAAEVSSNAAITGGEFVAEVIAGVLAGRSFSARVMSKYDELKVPRLRKATP